MKFISLIFLLSILFIMSCGEEAEVISDSGSFIFGSYYGECIGDCAHLFKLEGDQLYEDDINNLYIEEPDQFMSEPITTTEKIALAMEIRDAFPNALLMTNDSIIGCPDCADQGGYYFEFKTQILNRHWRVDTNTDGLDREIHDFIEEFSANLEVLKN